MSDELKKLDPAESRWQPVAVVNLGKEEPPDPQRPIATVCEIVGAAVFFSVMCSVVTMGVFIALTR